MPIIKIKQGDASPLGIYPILSVLPDKFAYYINYSYYTNYLFQIGWNLWALEYYTSSITGNLFSMSSPFKAFWENLRLCLLETQEPFRTTCETSFRAHPATAGREPATDAGCGLSTRGHWDGPVICNEWKGG